jgi:hypothetical protein
MGNSSQDDSHISGWIEGNADYTIGQYPLSHRAPRALLVVGSQQIVRNYRKIEQACAICVCKDITIP